MQLPGCRAKKMGPASENVQACEGVTQIGCCCGLGKSWVLGDANPAFMNPEELDKNWHTELNDE